MAAAKDHTLVLTEDGCLYAFGINTFHQLGIHPPPPNCSVPRQVKLTSLLRRCFRCAYTFVLSCTKCAHLVSMNILYRPSLPPPNFYSCPSQSLQFKIIYTHIHTSDIVPSNIVWYLLFILQYLYSALLLKILGSSQSLLVEGF